MLKKIGFALCIIGLLATIAIPYYMKNNHINDEKVKEDLIEDAQIDLYAFDPNNIARIEIKDERVLILQRQAGKWIDSEYKELDYKNLAIEELIDTVSSLESTEVIYEVLDQKKYGIDDTTRIITLYDEANNNYTLRLGSATPDKMAFYLGTHLDETLYVVKSQAVEALFQTRDDLIEKEVSMPFKATLQDIKVIKKNEPTIHIRKNQELGYKNHEKWVLEGFFKQVHELHTQNTEDIIDQVFSLEKGKFVGDQENLIQYGLDDPELVLTINNEWTMSFGAKENDWVYFMTSNDPYIYKMLDDNFQVISHIKPITLLRKQVYIPDTSKLSQIVLSDLERTLVLDFKQDSGEGEAINTVAFMEDISFDHLQTEKIIQLIQNNICIEAVLQNPEIEKREARKAEVTISYHFEEGDTQTIELIPYDSYFFILRLDGTIEFAVGKQQVMSMLNTLNEIVKVSES